MTRSFSHMFCWFCIFLAVGGWTSTKAAQCTSYDAVIESKKGPEISIPDSMLENSDAAAKCLVGALKTLAEGSPSLEFSWELRTQLNRSSGALLRLIRRNESSQSIIKKIRLKDNHDVINLLAYGARSKDRPTRLNSTQLLANIVDNTSVCVVMDHFADPNFFTIGSGVNGRANLAAVVAVVAPWAYKENYDNISKLFEFLSKEIVGEKNVLQTKKILKTMKARLDYQGDRGNKNSSLPIVLNDCLDFKPEWAKNKAKFKLTY